MESPTKKCIFCLNLFNDRNCERLEGSLMDCMEVLLMNSQTLSMTESYGTCWRTEIQNNKNLFKLKQSKQQIICNDCQEKLKDAFQFKSIYLSTEDYLFPYISNENDCDAVDLKMVYLNEKSYNESLFCSDMEVCRFCMELFKSSSMTMFFKLLEDSQIKEAFSKYITEINLHATKNPLICEFCLIALKRFSDFMTTISCLETKAANKNTQRRKSRCEKIKPIETTARGIIKINYFDNDSVNVDAKEKIKNEAKEGTDHVEIKYIDEEPMSKEFGKGIKVGVNNERMRETNTNINDITTNENYSVPLLMILEDTLEGERKEGNISIKSEFSNFGAQANNSKVKSRRRSKLDAAQQDRLDIENRRKLHVLFQKTSDDDDIGKCPCCSYQGSFREVFEHLQKYHLCREELRRKYNITMSPKTRKFTCEVCVFDTKIRRKLEYHMVIAHRELVKKNKMKCKLCIFETDSDYFLTRHMISHKEESKYVNKITAASWCHICSRMFSPIENHMKRTHFDSADLKTHCCSACGFKTYQVEVLEKHLKFHEGRRKGLAAKPKHLK